MCFIIDAPIEEHSYVLLEEGMQDDVSAVPIMRGFLIWMEDWIKYQHRMDIRVLG
jgi:hypothetical protein